MLLISSALFLVSVVSVAIFNVSMSVGILTLAQLSHHFLPNGHSAMDKALACLQAVRANTQTCSKILRTPIVSHNPTACTLSQ